MSISDIEATRHRTPHPVFLGPGSIACSAPSTEEKTSTMIGHMKAKVHLGRCYIKGRRPDFVALDALAFEAAHILVEVGPRRPCRLGPRSTLLACRP